MFLFFLGKFMFSKSDILTDNESNLFLQKKRADLLSFILQFKKKGGGGRGAVK